MTFKDIVEKTILPIGNGIVILLFALAFFFFVYTLLQVFFLTKADPKKQAEGKQALVWGLIALVVLFSIWGIVNLLVKGITF